jgi:hypothetical protein
MLISCRLSDRFAVLHPGVEIQNLAGGECRWHEWFDERQPASAAGRIVATTAELGSKRTAITGPT